MYMKNRTRKTWVTEWYTATRKTTFWIYNSFTRIKKRKKRTMYMNASVTRHFEIQFPPSFTHFFSDYRKESLLADLKRNQVISIIQSIAHCNAAGDATTPLLLPFSGWIRGRNCGVFDDVCMNAFLLYKNETWDKKPYRKNIFDRFSSFLRVSSFLPFYFGDSELYFSRTDGRYRHAFEKPIIMMKWISW